MTRSVKAKSPEPWEELPAWQFAEESREQEIGRLQRLQREVIAKYPKHGHGRFNWQAAHAKRTQDRLDLLLGKRKPTKKEKGG